MAEYEGSLVDLLREGQEGREPQQFADFVTVESDIYPHLSVYYGEQAQLWLARRQNARR